MVHGKKERKKEEEENNWRLIVFAPFLITIIIILLLLFLSFFLSVDHELVHGRSQKLLDRIHIAKNRNWSVSKVRKLDL
jgi:uncharacterized protein YpmS